MSTRTTDTKSTSSEAAQEKLMEDLRLMMEDAEELLQVTANHAGEGAATARARIQESLQVVKEHLLAIDPSVIERTRQAAKAADQYVHDDPWKAIGISVCAGLIVGMLVARR